MTLSAITVRKAEPEDAGAIQSILRAAFPSAAEARLVTLLEQQTDPLISLVAEVEGSLEGHILFSPVTLETSGVRIMGLGPMAVAPSLQRRGIGSALVRAGLAACGEAGQVGVVVLGHPDYYPRFGFKHACSFGLECEFDVPPEVFMAMELDPGALRPYRGVVRYHPAFRSV